MCGIVGVLAIDGVVDPQILQRMNDLLAHRGPDGEGFMFASGDWAQPEYSLCRRTNGAIASRPVRVGLGHRRLAILDLSERGLQPMATPDRQTWIVFNGEIYNHRSIRSDLEAHGFAFSTRTDTEVLLNAYAHWGDACVEHLSGMFAFAIWDGVRRRLFCARDRLGIKPFYYAAPKGYFLFASEIKALLAFPTCRREVDDAAAAGFLVHNNCDFAESTTFRDIHALAPAHTLVVEVSGAFRVRRYWALNAASSDTRNTHEQVERLREMLLKTVRSHLISDVRAGSCLSGGLDSSTLVSIIGHLRREDPEAAAATGDCLYTFTSCYHTERAFDEREYALQVARAVQAKPHLVFPSAADFWADFEKMAWHQDMPFGGLSYYAQWRVMRAASEAGVKVLIDGQGGDEVFGGYAKFRYAYLASLLRSGRFRTVGREVAGMLRRADPYVRDIRNGYRYLPASLRRLVNVDAVQQRVMRTGWREAMDRESSPATRWWRNMRHTSSGSSLSLVQQIQIDDITLDTLPQLLRMEDRSSMAFSLESRVPLLDHELVQFGVSLPDELKVSSGWSKFAMRQAMTGLLPECVRLRRSKLGFSAPDKQWLAEDLRGQLAELLHGEFRCRRFIDIAALRAWYTSPRSASANTSSYIGLFRILSLEMWMRAFSLS